MCRKLFERHKDLTCSNPKCQKGGRMFLFVEEQAVRGPAYQFRADHSGASGTLDGHCDCAVWRSKCMVEDGWRHKANERL